MATYEPPVSELVKLGRPEGERDHLDYAVLGIGRDHVPELIRLMQDQELVWAASELPDVYAQIHAWRALGQLRAEEAIEPLLDMLAAEGDADTDDWNDWLTEEGPRVLGMIGPAALARTAARLERRGSQEWPPIYFAQALTEIAKRHPETRDEVVGQLLRVLRTPVMNHPGVNGSVIYDLVELKAVEAWPAIEKVFESGNVDEFSSGDAATVKYDLGLGPKPASRESTRYLPPVRESSAKARFLERQRQKKLAKKAQKKKRKGM